MFLRRTIAFGTGVVLAMPLMVLAEDIEVYTGQNLSAGARPNVVFVIDNTVNMIAGHKQLPIHDEYDPDYTYSGNCERDRVYMVSSATKPTRFEESFRWDDEPNSFSGEEDDGCAQVYPFYPVLLAAQDVWGNAVGDPVHETATTTRCVAARADLAVRGYFEDKMRWRRNEPWNGGWVYRAGLNDGDLGVDPIFWMEDYDCNSDGAIGGTESFFLFTGNYINWWFNDRETRLAVAQRGIKKMIDGLPDGGVNVGIMPFTENSLGARVLYPAVNIAGNQPALKTAVDSLVGDVGMRAFAGAFFEVYNYYSGSKPVIGEWNDPKSVASSWLPDMSAYDTPADLTCQTNHAVLITDGVPNENNSSVIAGLINDLPDFTTLVGNCSSALGADCAKRLASYMNKRDVNSTLDGTQHVNIHAIGIGIPGTETFFTELVTAGGGQYVVAQSADDLADAVRNLFENSIVINGTFVAPAVSVNAFNRSQHRNELFFAVFQVGEKYRWNGNLKKYQIGTLGDGSVGILDANGNPAIDSATGEFAETARSWWSASADGNDPVLGGGNARLEEWVGSATQRKLYTDVSATNSLLVAGNELVATNSNITAAHTNAGSETISDNWINQLYAGDLRSKYGDPLHSRPIVVNYGGTDASPDAVAYFTTNDGFLHAVRPGNSTTTDSGGGYELFGFMPKEMLKKLGQLVGTGVTAKGYGLDGSITPWINDLGTSGEISGGDHAYLYFGAGRGGRLYYGVDVTSYSDPKKLWSAPIQGGVGGMFNELGYTTGEPARGRIRINTVDYDVLVLSGGYDPDYDILPIDVGATDSGQDMGRAIFIVDAKTGARLWTGSFGGFADKFFPDMTYPIAASVRLLDINNDGYSDRMYVGDLGGQLWRFDINNGSGGSALVNGGVIARLGSGLTSGEGAGTRRFFNTPDVALVNNNGGAPYLAVNLGSGNRSRPVADDITQDIFFSIRDPFVFDLPPDYTTSYGIDLSGSDLVDVTGVVEPVFPPAAQGWYLRMRSGEKVLAESRTFENQVMFTTYQPDSSISGNSCQPNLGIGRVYAVDLRNADPIVDSDGDGVEESTDRSQELQRTGIPPEVVVLFPEATNGRPVALVGPELVDVQLGNTRYRSYWTDQVNEE